MNNFYLNQKWGNFGRWYLLLLSLVFFTPAAVFAHAGHGDEFKNESTQIPGAIQVDKQTVKRLNLKVEPVKLQRLDRGLKTTGQIDHLPNQKVEVTAPVEGTVKELLVKPGDVVNFGDPIAVLSSSELAALRVKSLENSGEAEASFKEAEANLILAKENYDRITKISDSEIAGAEKQLAAAKAQYQRDKELVDSGSVVEVARENYQRQIEIAEAEISQIETELVVAQEQYDRDKELTEKGVISRRQMLASQAKLAEVKARLTRAKTRPNVGEASTEIKRAEVELPVKELRESEAKVAEAEEQLTRAMQRRDVLEAENQLKRAEASLEGVKSRLKLSNAAYNLRLQQLETKANEKGFVIVSAPISGSVVNRQITVGETVESANKPLMTLLNDKQVLAIANIYEKDIDKVRLAQPVRVKVESLPERIFMGKISLIGSVVEGETRVMPVQVELDNSEGNLKIGMFAELEILIDKTIEEVLVVPTSAVVETNGKKIVYVQNGNSFQPTEVSLGQVSGDLVEVKSGLFDGDFVVTQRTPQLFAQSLRGDSTNKDEHQKTDNHDTEERKNSFPVPFLLVGLGLSSVLGLAAFMGGAFWAGRRFQQNKIYEDPADFSESLGVSQEVVFEQIYKKEPVSAGEHFGGNDG
ncbi:MAG TPA: efflux RND transporter periplasmic adaptor subunit [Halomicronema sp.]